MNLHGSWVIVADAAQARIFQARGADSELVQLQRLEHEEQRLHAGDLRTGGTGEQQESVGASSHQADPQTSTMEKHADMFAKQLAETLRKLRHEEHCDRFILVAAPAFLGRLRDHLDSATQQCIGLEIDKNWAQHDAAQVQKLLKKQPKIVH